VQCAEMNAAEKQGATGESAGEHATNRSTRLEGQRAPSKGSGRRASKGTRAVNTRLLEAAP